MDAVEFLKIVYRLIERGALDGKTHYNQCMDMETERYDAIIDYAERWIKEHPRKTRQSEFLKQWPEALVDTSGTLCIDPCNVDKQLKGEAYCKAQENCYGCRREFWMQEVE